MKNLLLLSTFASLLILLNPNRCSSQAVGISGTSSIPDPSALLDVDATGMSAKKGFLMPRLTTTERDAIATGCSCTPAEGLIIFNTTTKCFETFVNSAWSTLSCPSACVPPAAPAANAASGLACTSFTANWSASSGATSYYLDVSLNSGFSSFITGYNNINVGNVTSSGVTGLTAGTTYYYRLRAATACVSGNSNTITTATTAAPAAAGTISGTTPVCQSQNGVAFSVGAISGATSYTWSYSGTGFTCATNCATNSITANFSGTATGGNLTVYGTNACGNGTTSPNYAITVNAPPTTAAAGTDINPSCGVTTATLAGNTPSVGTGEWSVVSGTATITTPSSSTSGVTGLVLPGTATLRWTISNSPCTASTDDVVITSTCFTDARDSKNYNAVLIGTQWWMKENLSYGTYVAVATGGQAGGGTQKYCQNSSGVNDASCPFGGLYEWTEMMNGSATCDGTGTPPNDRCATPVQGICPSGWHIPSHYELTTLEKNAGTNPGAFPYDESTTGNLGTDEGGNLKQTGTTNWTSPNTGATDSKGFTALPAGRAYLGTFNYVGWRAYLWSSTESGTSAWVRLLKYTGAGVDRLQMDKAYAFSVRCVKD